MAFRELSKIVTSQSDGEIPRGCYKVSAGFSEEKISEQKQAQIHTQQELHPRPLEGAVTNIHTVASGRKFHTTFELQKREEKTLRTLS